MSLGDITAKVVSDHPHRTYYGTSDLLTGNIVLQYHPKRPRGHGPRGKSPVQPELFGPLQLDLVFQGRVESRYSEDTSSGFTKRDDFLSKTIRRVHDGPFRAAPREEVKLPFYFTFPELAVPMADVTGVVHDEGRCKWVSSADAVPTEELPPSFSMNFFTYGDRGKVSVVYWLEPALQMPGIDVKFRVADYKQKIHYERAHMPRLPRSIEVFMHSYIVIQTMDLLPQTERPQGFREKMKAIFMSGEQPRYCFDVFCSGIPQVMTLGQSLDVEVAVRTNRDRSTVQADPVLQLDHFKAEIVAQTTLKVDQRCRESDRPKDTQVVRTIHVDTTPSGPFTEANNYTKTVGTPPLMDVPSTSTVGLLSRTYKLRIELQFTAAGQTRYARQDFPLTIHPPVLQFPEIVEAEPSRVDAGPVSADEEQLPAYHEAAAEAVLPQLVAEKPQVINDDLR